MTSFFYLPAIVLIFSVSIYESSGGKEFCEDISGERWRQLQHAREGTSRARRRFPVKIR